LKRFPDNKFFKHDYLESRKEKNKLKKKLLSLYCKKKIDDNASNPKKMWSAINEIVKNGKARKKSTPLSLTVNGAIIDSPKCIANEFNTYFVSVATHLLAKVTSRSPDPIHVSISNNNTLHFVSVQGSLVTQIVSKLKNSSFSIGDDQQLLLRRVLIKR